MSKIAFIYPGQGAQVADKGRKRDLRPGNRYPGILRSGALLYGE